MEDWVGIYKGLRLPLLGVLLVAIAIYVYWPRNKKKLEQAKFNMLADDLDELEKVRSKKGGNT